MDMNRVVDQPPDPVYWAATMRSVRAESAIFPTQAEAEARAVELARVRGEPMRVLRDAGIVARVSTAHPDGTLVKAGAS